MEKSFRIFICFQWLALGGYAQVIDSLELNHLKKRVSIFEILIGASQVGVRGDEGIPTRFGQTLYINPLENKLSYSVGIGAHHKIGRYFQIYGRVLCEQKGFVRSLDSLFFDTDFNFVSRTRVWSEIAKNNYLTLSVLPQFVAGRRAQINIGAGGYFALLVSSRTQYEDYRQGSYQYSSDPIYNGRDYGLCFNVGISYPLGSKFDATMQMMVNYGLAHISDFNLTFNYPKWYNQTYLMTVGIRMKRNKRFIL
jgi:hypothetical protein